MTDPTCTLVTRRAFLTGLGATVALAACGGSNIAVLSPKERGAGLPAGSLGSRTDRVLVVVELGGGNDGLSMVVPHGSDRYHDLRRSTRIESPIDLDGEIGLHPNLPELAGMYGAGEVAIVEGVGMPNPDLSHFTSMDRWWTGTTDSVSRAGWLGRYLDGTVGFDDPLAGIVIGPGPTPAMLGDSSFTVAISDASGLTPDVPAWIDDVDVEGLRPGGSHDDRSLRRPAGDRSQCGSPRVAGHRPRSASTSGSQGARDGPDRPAAAGLGDCRPPDCVTADRHAAGCSWRPGPDRHAQCTDERLG